jgi:hypothetical protein
MRIALTTPTATIVRRIGTLTLATGIATAISGILVWLLVTAQLTAERIIVSADSTLFGGILAGRRVTGPLTAYAQAEVINTHARSVSNGLSYAELSPADPVSTTLMSASFLRSSLFTAVVAFGLCVFAFVVGAMLIAHGALLRTVARGDGGRSRATVTEAARGVSFDIAQDNSAVNDIRAGSSTAPTDSAGAVGKVESNVLDLTWLPRPLGSASQPAPTPVVADRWAPVAEPVAAVTSGPHSRPTRLPTRRELAGRR